MPINEGSKPISKGDDAAKDFLRQSLDGHFTRGFDVDSVYCEVIGGNVRWTLFEFLKCDTVEPQASHPNRYWNGKTSNKRKFLSLWTLCQSLLKGNVEARLLLVNYRDSKSNIKLMHVTNVEDGSITTKDKVMTFQDWCVWFQNFNDNKQGATWEALHLLK